MNSYKNEDCIKNDEIMHAHSEEKIVPKMWTDNEPRRNVQRVVADFLRKMPELREVDDVRIRELSSELAESIVFTKGKFVNSI